MNENDLPQGMKMPSFDGGGSSNPTPKKGGMGHQPSPEGMKSTPSSSKQSTTKSRGDGSMATNSFLGRVGEQFLMWNLVSYVKSNPIKAIAEGVCFVCVGAPFLYGLTFGYQVNIPGVGFFTVPASTIGIGIRTGLGAATSIALREDGSPALYPEGTVEIKQVGTGITLKDIQSGEGE